MLFALLVACATHNKDLPDYDADKPTPESEPVETSSYEPYGGAAPGGTYEPKDGATDPMDPAATGDQTAMRKSTHMAVARLEPRAGSKVTGNITLTETVMQSPSDMGDTWGSTTEDEPDKMPATAGTAPDGSAPTGIHDQAATASVRVVIHLENASPGDHIVRLDTRGECGTGSKSAATSTDKGTPTSADKGTETSATGATAGFSGDLGMVNVNADGIGHKELTTTGFSLGEGTNSINGMAIAIYKGAGPSGMAGGVSEGGAANTGTANIAPDTAAASGADTANKPLACGIVTTQVAQK